MIRRTPAVLAALAMLLVLVVPALAGGWSEIVADGQTSKRPVEGQPTEVGFKVMQHGVTPAPWETATVHFTDLGSGEKIDVVATNDNPNGHFSATATLPHAGFWTWQVTLKDLLSEHVPVTMSVRAASGALPPFDPAITLSAIDRAKSEVRTELTQQFAADIERLDQQAEGFRARIAYLDTQAKTLQAERDALAGGRRVRQRTPRAGHRRPVGPCRRSRWVRDVVAGRLPAARGERGRSQAGSEERRRDLIA